MSFPISPTNGQTASINGITYTYNSTNGTWTRVPADAFSASSFANGAFVTANSAASFANGAFDRANAAYAQANTGGGGGTTDAWARDTANAAFITANAAYAQANTGGGGGTTDAWARNTANASFITANSSYIAQNITASFANAAYTHANAAFLKANSEIIIFAVTDDTSNLTVSAARASFRAPSAMTLTSIPRASLNVASTSGLVNVDIKLVGTTILGANKLTIDATEKTSTTAATPTTLTTTSIADDAEITVDIIAAGVGAKGLKITFYYTD